MDEIIDVNTLFGPLPAGSTDPSADDLLAMMRAANVKRACTLSTLGILISPHIGNAASRAACAEHPEFIPVATLNPMHYFGDAAPIDAIKADGFSMVRFFPSDQEWPLDIAPFRLVLAKLAPTGLPIMVNVDAPGQISTLARASEGYPGAVILSGVTDLLLAEAIAVMRERATWHVETSRLLACGCIKAVADCVGAQRLLHGTGAPAAPMVAMFQTLRASGISQEAMMQTVSGNARRVLGL